MITFRLAEHEARPGISCVEILWDGVLCGVIYPRGPKMCVMSAHFHGLDWPPDGELCEGRPSILINHVDVPFVELTFQPPRPYTLDVEARKLRRIR